MTSIDNTSGAELKTRFDQQGFVVVRDFLDRGELLELFSELDRYIEHVVPTLSKEKAFYQDPDRPETLKQMQHMDVDPFFAEYRFHPAWNGLAETLLGEPVEPVTPEWFNKPPGTEHATPPHQDNYYLCYHPPQVVTLWLAIDPVDEGNGCLRYLPGSHLHPIRPHSPTEVLGFSQGITDYCDDDRQQEMAVTMEPGDIVAHHGKVIHRAEANQSGDRQRRAYATVFHAASCGKDSEALAHYQSQLKNQHDRINVDPSSTEEE